MNYLQTIEYLYNTLPMFSHMGSAAFKKDLHNTILLCDHLGNPQNKFKSIHVAGTNGKGSVSHMLAAIFQSAGFKTGLYTSPHLYDFRERIKLNGEMAEQEFVVDFVERVKPLIEQIQPSFFEITVAMAFEYFALKKVDIAVIEVGLGGRLDSTNVIQPELSVITNIGWDHMNMLGNTLEEIAKEKAGIIKRNTPVVIGEKQEETTDVFFDIANDKNAPIHFASDNYEPISFSWRNNYFQLEVLNKKENLRVNYNTDLQGIYQQRNVCTVLEACDVLIQNAYSLSEQHIRTGLENVKHLTGLLGRWEIIHSNPTVVLEVAHNVNGIQEMLKHIERQDFNQLHLVIGMVKDKDIERVLSLLPTNAQYYFTQSHIPRALAASSLQEKARTFSLTGELFENVNLALENAICNVANDDLIIVCGSIFLVAEVDRNSFAEQRRK